MSARRANPQERPDRRGEGEPDGGMVPLEEFEAAEAERQAAGASAGPPVEPPLPEVEAGRLHELKAEARRQIEQRLATRRRQRQLMRGAEQERGS